MVSLLIKSLTKNLINYKNKPNLNISGLLHRNKIILRSYYPKLINRYVNFKSKNKRFKKLKKKILKKLDIDFPVNWNIVQLISHGLPLFSSLEYGRNVYNFFPMNLFVYQLISPLRDFFYTKTIVLIGLYVAVFSFAVFNRHIPCYLRHQFFVASQFEIILLIYKYLRPLIPPNLKWSFLHTNLTSFIYTISIGLALFDNLKGIEKTMPECSRDYKDDLYVTVSWPDRIQRLIDKS